ncbi:Transcription factor MYB80, partial [Dissostichus eleginoides]
ALGGANNHSSLSHCVTEVLNPPFVLHITCLSMGCLVLHFRHLDGHAFKGGAGAPREAQ